MNLWAKTALRQLTILTVALFFFSCEDESSLLGFKNPNKKFKVNYVDIPIASSVLLLDSLRTSNNYSQTETVRMLVGKYSDPEFGEISSTAISQFFTVNASKTLLKESAELDSISVELSFDFYTYGSQAATPQTINIHEVEKELIYDSANYYFNRSNTAYNPTPLGSKTFTIDPSDFEEYIEENDDTTIVVSIPLDLDFGKRIFESALTHRNGTTAADSTFAKLGEFVKVFKGLAIVPASGDKIIGFNPRSAGTRVILHYHDAETDSLRLAMVLSGLVSTGGLINYNEIDADRSATGLSQLTQYSQPVTPDNGLRYVQNGTGVLTQLDFSKFYEFADADSNSLMIVTEAELHLGTPQATTGLDPINAFSLRAMKSEGYLKKVADPKVDKAQYLADSLSIRLYAGQMALSGSYFTPVGADGNVFIISKSGSNTYYNGFLTLFAQQLYKKDPNKERFRYFALFPESPQIGKALNRVVFEEQNIRLRVYYTRPSTLTPL